MLDWLLGDPYDTPCGAGPRGRRRLLRRIARDFLRERPAWATTNVQRPAEAIFDELCAEAGADARVGREVLARVHRYYHRAP
jgi:hypothetical protein